MATVVRDDHATPLDRPPLDLPAFERALAADVDWNEPAPVSTGHEPLSQSGASGEVQTVQLLSTTLGRTKDAARIAALQVEEIPDTVEALFEATKAAFPRPVLATTAEGVAAAAAAGDAADKPHPVLYIKFYSSTTSRAVARIEARSDASLSDLFAAFPCTSEAALLRVDDMRYTTAADGSLAAYMADAPPTAVRRFTRTTAPRLRDLRPRVGMPYLFVHDGDCEHRVIVTDVRASRDAPGGVKCTWKAPPDVLPCDVCHMREVAMSVFGDRLADKSPIRYCEPCLALRLTGTHQNAAMLSGDFSTSVVEHQPLLKKDG